MKFESWAPIGTSWPLVIYSELRLLFMLSYVCVLPVSMWVSSSFHSPVSSLQNLV